MFSYHKRFRVGRDPRQRTAMIRRRNTVTQRKKDCGGVSEKLGVERKHARGDAF